MTRSTESLEREALDWVIRLRHAEAEDWAAFDAWLAEDPTRADSYWRLAAADADMGEALLLEKPPAQLVRLAEARPRRRRRLAPIFLALAASFALAAGCYWLLAPSAGPVKSETLALETRPGERREATLPDGTQVALNGDTRIEVDGADPRKVRLSRGEARFQVVHDPRRPFVLGAGAVRLRDVGTVFDVTREGSALRVAVAEGAILYEDGSASERLGAGDMLSRDSTGSVRRTRIDPADVAAWRDARLVYDRAPLATVVADLARATGVSLVMDPAIAHRSFSGGIRLGKDGAETIRRAAAVLGVKARREGGGWRLAKR